jgi:tetratricopeptide (TPR) repeat protein
VRLAELAIASLDGVAAHLSSEELANKKAQGWAWLGNARGLALDYPAAEQGFIKARKMLPKEPWHEVLAEICLLEADFFLFRSDFKKALGLNDQAVELFRSIGKGELLARSLVARASTIGRARGWQCSIPDLQEASEYLDSTSQPHLLLAAHQNLVSVYVLCGQHSKAIERLPEVRALCMRVADPLALNQLLWTEALLKLGLDDYEAAAWQASKARQGFASLGEFGYAAAVDLDLAEIELKKGKPANAVSCALRAIPVFESLEVHREALTALTLLGTVAVDQEVRLETIRQIRNCLIPLLPAALGWKASGPE